MWKHSTSEKWYEFADRQYEAEKELEARLSRLPGCQLRIGLDRLYVELSLGGVRVESKAGLRGACRAWAAEMRKRAEGCGPPTRPSEGGAERAHRAAG